MNILCKVIQAVSGIPDTWKMGSGDVASGKTDKMFDKGMAEGFRHAILENQFKTKKRNFVPFRLLPNEMKEPIRDAWRTAWRNNLGRDRNVREVTQHALVDFKIWCKNNHSEE